MTEELNQALINAAARKLPTLFVLERDSGELMYLGTSCDRETVTSDGLENCFNCIEAAARTLIGQEEAELSIRDVFITL